MPSAPPSSAPPSSSAPSSAPPSSAPPSSILASNPRLVRFARRAERGLGLVCLGLPVVIALYVFASDTALLGHPWLAPMLDKLGLDKLELGDQPGLPLAATTLSVRALALAILLACTMPMLLALLAARRLFALYAEGGVFSPQAARQVHRIGLWLLISVPVEPIGSSLLSAVMGAAWGTGGFALSISSSGLWLGLFGIILLGIGGALRLSADLAADHAQIV